MVDMNTLDRIATKVDFRDDGCWLWTGYRTPRGGYGRIGVDRKVHRVHRLVWELVVGPIPDGLELDHTCQVGACLNPDHLEPVTQAENSRRASGTSCPKGHEYTPENTYYRPSRPTHRICRACRAAGRNPR